MESDYLLKWEKKEDELIEAFAFYFEYKGQAHDNISIPLNAPGRIC